jgi:tetratricopeptide (TPR) repeat protein
MCPGMSLAQTAKQTASDPSALAQKGIHLAESGRCSEALPILKKSASHAPDKAVKLKAGLATIRCAMTAGNVDAALGALQWLNREFPSDPDVLYASTHAFSDLSTRAAQELGRTAPQSYQAHELNAESLELQGKWDQAQKEYETILQQNPSVPGIHFRLGRLLLSKPNPGPDMAEQAKKEFEAELKIDPNNAGAEYVLGELARENQQWEDAIQHFGRAAKLDAAFGDAYLGLGQSLISTKKYSEAIAPLETAVKLEPENPATHYNLATAYSRTGRKQDADKEFAIHRQMTQKQPQDTPQ